MSQLLRRRAGRLLTLLILASCGDDATTSGGGQGSGGHTASGGDDAAGGSGAQGSGANAGDGGGGPVTVSTACRNYCVTLVALGCYPDEDQCTDGCLDETEGDPCPIDLAAFLQCVADFATSCEDRARECDDESLAYEICLSPDP